MLITMMIHYVITLSTRYSWVAMSWSLRVRVASLLELTAAAPSSPAGTS